MGPSIVRDFAVAKSAHCRGFAPGPGIVRDGRCASPQRLLWLDLPARWIFPLAPSARLGKLQRNDWSRLA